MKIFKIILLLSSLFVFRNALADSDGVYCSGKDYVAIEARGIWVSAESPSVYIITIDSEGNLNRHVISTPPNLNKRLKCEDNRVVLSDGHLIEWSKSSAPVFSKTIINTEIDFSNSQLPYIKKPKTIKLQTTDNTHLYSLVLNHNLQTPKQGMILNYFTARVVKVTSYGHFVSSKLLAEGVRLETID